MKKSEVSALVDEVYASLDDTDTDMAVMQAMRVLAHAPHDAESFLLLAEVFEEKGDEEQALSWVEQGLKHEPHHEALLLKKASLLLDSFDDLDAAFAILESIKQSFGESPVEELKQRYDASLLLDVYLLLTDCYRLKTDYVNAMFYAELALKLDVNQEAARLAVATAHFELGHFDQALSLLEVKKTNDQSDYYWVLGQVHCAKGNFIEADHCFQEANRLDKASYHRPIRVSESVFFGCFEQAVLALPKEIRDFLHASAVRVMPIVPEAMLAKSAQHLSPSACMWVQKIDKNYTIYLFQKNIENMAHKKSEIRDVVASAMLHELGKIVSF